MVVDVGVNVKDSPTHRIKLLSGIFTDGLAIFHLYFKRTIQLEYWLPDNRTGISTKLSVLGGLFLQFKLNVPVDLSSSPCQDTVIPKTVTEQFGL